MPLSENLHEIYNASYTLEGSGECVDDVGGFDVPQWMCSAAVAGYSWSPRGWAVAILYVLLLVSISLGYTYVWLQERAYGVGPSDWDAATSANGCGRLYRWWLRNAGKSGWLYWIALPTSFVTMCYFVVWDLTRIGVMEEDGQGHISWKNHSVIDDTASR